MGALRKAALQPRETEIIIIPFDQARPEAGRKGLRNDLAGQSVWASMAEQEWLDILQFQIKGLGFIAFVAAMMYIAYSGMYAAKGWAGIDIVPSQHVEWAQPKAFATGGPDWATPDRFLD